MSEHVWEWMGTTCVNCCLTPTEIAERGHTRCTAYVPDDFMSTDPAELWKSIEGAAKGK